MLINDYLSFTLKKNERETYTFVLSRQLTYTGFDTSFTAISVIGAIDRSCAAALKSNLMSHVNVNREQKEMFFSQR